MPDPKQPGAAANEDGGSGQTQSEVRVVNVEVKLRAGHSHQFMLAENAPELVDLFRALAWRTQPGRPQGEWYFQLPTDNGRAAVAFDSSQIVSVITRPPVLIKVELPEAQHTSTPDTQTVLHHPNHVVVDDFLTRDEHQRMLKFALGNESNFEKGTVTSNEGGYRTNLVILQFGQTNLSKLFTNRLLVMLPMLHKLLGKPMVALDSVECQLTASNDGHYFKNHMDWAAEGDVASRLLTCVYYFNATPKNYSGGQLRIYHTYENAGQRWTANSYREIEPRNNRLVVFPSDLYHELRVIRCPSMRFEDSRFAITSWVRRTDAPDPAAAFGWGHFHCGRPLPQA